MLSLNPQDIFPESLANEGEKAFILARTALVNRAEGDERWKLDMAAACAFPWPGDLNPQRSASATAADKQVAIQRFFDAFQLAGSTLRRAMLFHGLQGAIGPDFESGWSGVLWERLVAIEPIEVALLLAVQDAGDTLTVSSTDPAIELAERLVRGGLLESNSNTGTSVTVSLRGVAPKLLSFLQLRDRE